jgi:hypothetical protein
MARNYKRLADSLAWLHGAWVIIGLLSLPLLFFILWWKVVVLAFVGMNIVTWTIFRGCWMTQLENRWRKKVNPEGGFEHEGFIRHYLRTLLHINCSPGAVRIGNYSFLALLLLISFLR